MLTRTVCHCLAWNCEQCFPFLKPRHVVFKLNAKLFKTEPLVCLVRWVYLIIFHHIVPTLIWCIVAVYRQGHTLIADMASKKTKGKNMKKRAHRATSNVFAMFDQCQIQEFKEAFNMIDHNRDGFIDKEDLHDMLASLGTSLSSIKGVNF